MFDKNATILFQGDSITDGARGRTEDLNHILGHGYVFLIAARLCADRPDLNLHFVNRGCSGNTVVDMHARWKEDAIALAPNVVSILIGVNDVYLRAFGGTSIPVDLYEGVYRTTLKETLEALPKVRFVLCEPFALPVGPRKESWKEDRAHIDKLRAVVKRLAREFNAVFVQTQDAFDAASKKPSPEYWMWDGIHPMPAGHELLARAWLSAVERHSQP